MRFDFSLDAHLARGGEAPRQPSKVDELWEEVRACHDKRARAVASGDVEVARDANNWLGGVLKALSIVLDEDLESVHGQMIVRFGAEPTTAIAPLQHPLVNPAAAIRPKGTT